MNRKIAIIMMVVIGWPLVGLAEETPVQNPNETARARMGEIRDQAHFRKMVDEASEVYSAIARGPHQEVPTGILKNARCIAVLPNVYTGAVLVGGTHGEGLASCKDGTNTWSQPAAISLSQGSIGLQAGAKSTDLVLFFQNREAEKMLKHGDFSLGADISAVAGKYDSSYDTSTDGVVIYSRTEGVFAGASVNGSKISKNQEELAAYYGKKVDYTALLERRELPDSAGHSAKLTKLFP